MNSKLKRDQIPTQKALDWRKNFKEEKKMSFTLKVPQIILQKETYKKLAGENENRVRIYLGLQPNDESKQYELCAFAVSAFLLGSGDVYVDYETPVFKLERQNVDYSSRTAEVRESLKRYRSWRAGELDADEKYADCRQYIYPSAYLLTKFELHEIFNVQDKKEAQIEFGISKTMDAMIIPGNGETRGQKVMMEVYNHAVPCPPNCDDRSPYNL